VAMISIRPPQASIPPATIILKRPDARTIPCQVCVFSTLVSDADAIQIPAIKKSRKATSATLTPPVWEKAMSLTFEVMLVRCHAGGRQPHLLDRPFA
jgi:hypothetical protein